MAGKCTFKTSVFYREVRWERDVDFLSVWCDPVQEQGVVHGAVPCRLEPIKRPAGHRTRKQEPLQKLLNKMIIVL